ncbi:MAG TPA: hypothetical protein VMU16_08940 [Candidatus Binataceae bacterium]|nr:hypothetical protein [Candidatus Binataceae bacterium]
MNAQGRNPSDPESILKVSLGFLFIAIGVFVADFCYLFFSKPRGFPNPVASLGFAAAIAGIIALRAGRKSQVSDQDAAGSAHTRLFSPEGWGIFAVFVAFLVLYAVSGGIEISANNIHVLQAVAFLRGQFQIDPDAAGENVIFGGLSYQLHPAFPAVLLMPFAAIWGEDTNQTIFALIIGALDVALAWRLLGRMKVSTNIRVWLTLFFGAGTTIWWETINGGSWDMTRIIAIGFTLGALGEIFGRSRPVIVSLLAGLAALARSDLAPELPIYLALVYTQRRNWVDLLWMLPGFAFAAAIYIAMNEVRFGGWYDMTWSIAAGGQPTSQLFQLYYLPRNLFALFFRAPGLDAGRFPILHPIEAGQAITFLSPAFLLALKPDFRKTAPLLILIAALLAAAPSLFFIYDGVPQVGARHFVPTFPFLLVLMAMGMPRRADQFTKILITASLALVTFTVWHVQVWGFAG